MSENRLEFGSDPPWTEQPPSLLRTVILGLSKIIIYFNFWFTSSSFSFKYSLFFLPNNCQNIIFPFRTISLSPSQMRQLFQLASEPSALRTAISRQRKNFCAEIHPIAVLFRQRSSLCPTSQCSRGNQSKCQKLTFFELNECQKKSYCLQRQSRLIIIIINARGKNHTFGSPCRFMVYEQQYTFNHEELKLLQQLEANLAKAEIKPQWNTKKLKAIIGPHAGFRYSGPVAAWSYKYLSAFKDKPVRVFLLGPSHYKALNTVSFSVCTQLETPIGNINVDVQTINALKSEIQGKNFTKKDEEKQHSLQMHMPYLKHVLGDNFKVIPIIVGHLSAQTAVGLGEKLSKYFKDQNTIFVISSDFCHWGENFDYQPLNKQMTIHQFIKNLDSTGMKLIEKHDLQGFTKYIKKTENTICGQNPIKLLLSTILHSQLNLNTHFVQYDQSQKVTSPEQSSVSYASSITFLIS